MAEHFAVYNIHSPAVRIGSNGTMSHNHHDLIRLPAPLVVFETLAEAEQWRADRLKGVRNNE